MPTHADIARNESLRLPVPLDRELEEARRRVDEVRADPGVLKRMIGDMFRAHKEFLSTYILCIKQRSVGG